MALGRFTTKQQRDLGNNPRYGFRCLPRFNRRRDTPMRGRERSRKPALRYHDSEIIDAILISIFICPRARSFIENKRAPTRSISAKSSREKPPELPPRSLRRALVTHLRKSRRHRASYNVTPEKSQAIAADTADRAISINPRNVRDSRESHGQVAVGSRLISREYAPQESLSL